MPAALDPITLRSASKVACLLSFLSFVFQGLSLIPWDGDEAQFGAVIGSIGARSAYAVVSLIASSVLCAASFKTKDSPIEAYEEDFTH